MWWLVVLAATVYVLNWWLGNNSAGKEAVYAWKFVTPAVANPHVLVHDHFVERQSFPYRLQSRSAFQTVLHRGKKIRKGERYFYGDLKTVVTIIHQPTPDGLIRWSIQYQFDLKRPSDEKHVRAIGREATEGLRAHVISFAGQHRSMSA